MGFEPGLPGLLFFTKLQKISFTKCRTVFFPTISNNPTQHSFVQNFNAIAVV